MDGVDRVSIPLCRYEKLIDIETRVQVLIDRLDQKESICEEDIYLAFGYGKKYKSVKEEKERKSDEFWKKHLESQTGNTDSEKESVAPTKKNGEI